MQKGQIKRVGNCWLLRYYEPVVQDGLVVKRQKTTKLILSPELVGEKGEETAARAAADLILAPINAQTARPESRMTLAAFLEFVYLPYIQNAKRPSTYNSYCEMWRKVRPHLNGLELREATTGDIDKLLVAITSEKQRAHTTNRNVRNFLRGGFRYAIRQDMVVHNPVPDTEVPKGRPPGEKGHYTLAEIQAMLKVLPEPVKTFVTVAALTGLRKSELKGLCWEDWRDDALHIERSVWQGQISDTKTLSSKAPVPVLPIVRRALTAHRKRTTGKGFIFAGERSGKPLRIENVFRRDMAPVFKEKRIVWKGWHAFRRGLATNLNELGVDAKTIQTILRHSQISTTMNIYVQAPSKAARVAMGKLEKTFKG